MEKPLPKDLTSYDLLKTFAIVTMVCDHIGYYIFPWQLWWRVVGRLCVPIWFFLIGYAQSRDTGPKIWLGLAIVEASSFVVGMSFFTADILATMIFLRLTIDLVMKTATRSASNLWGLSMLFVLLADYSNRVFEYGTLALPMAMFGYFARNRGRLKEPQKIMTQYFAFSYVLYIASQTYWFRFQGPHILALSVGVLIVMAVLLVFRPVTFPKATAAMPRPVVALLRFTGRHTLPIYVAHLLLLRAWDLWHAPYRFALFHWCLYSHTGTCMQITGH